MLSPGSITNSVPDPDVAIRLQRDTQRAAQEQASATSLENSILPPNALATAVQFDVKSGTVANFAVQNFPALETISLTFTVPTAVTRALFTVTAIATARNPSTTVIGSVYARARINGVDGPQADGNVGPGLFGSTTTAMSAVLSALVPGSTIPISMRMGHQGSTGGADWPADAANYATIQAQVTFLQ